jgi:uncharacterized cupin superfamily protein
MVPEAELQQTEAGLVPNSGGGFVMNAREGRWIRLGMYHWEADQEDFLLLSGEALLIVEGEERPLRQWDFVHCPPETRHMIVGAGAGGCVVLGIGGRDHIDQNCNGDAYTVDEVALRHGARVDEETTDPGVAYARFAPSEPTRYRDDWLPSD